jgi:trehalose 2-sulfotransferase
LIGEPSEDLGSAYETWRQATHGRTGFSTYLLSRVGRVRGGVTSMKVHGYQRDRLLHELGLLRGAHRYRDAELIAAAFPMPSYVWLRRRDVVAQAISWLRAKRSGVWIGPQGPLGPLPDIERLDDLVRGAVGRLNAETERWQQWFSTNDLEPLQLFYEQLDVDPTAAVADVLSLVGVDVPEQLVVTPRTVRQADSASEQWIRGYRERQSDERGRQ